MMRTLLNFFAGIIGFLFLSACGDKKPDAPNPANMPVPVNLYEVHPEMATYYDKYPGTVVALMQVDIRAQAEGYITGIFFREGEHVSKGQKLYTIDDRKYQATYNHAESNVRVAEANEAQAQKDADRYIYLNQHEAVAKQTLDHAMTTLQNAKQQVNAARQELSRAKTDLGYSVITAPFDGTIGISQVKLGNTVVPGQTTLNTISTDGPMAVDFAASEKQIPRFLKLRHENSGILDSIFTLILPDNSLYNHVGKIQVIDRGVNPQTGTITIRLNFPNAGTSLRAGMSCTVRVRNDDTAQQLLIPSKAIVEQMGEYFVYVTKDTTVEVPAKDNQVKEKKTMPALRAAQKKIQLGQTIADRVIVKAGLQSGDKVVVDGVQKLHEGSILKTEEKPAPKNESGK